MSRKLATVRQVVKVAPIPEADNIEVATVDGWEVVVKKGTFSEGDYGVYFEIDSLLPRVEPFLFLFKGEEERYRLRTVKLRGQISQGFLLPLSDFPGIFYGRVMPPEGVAQELIACADLGDDDLTERLDILEYTRPEPKDVHARSNWLGLCPITDEDRMENVKREVEKLYGRPWIATVKIDGCSGTFLIHPETGEFHACSRRQSVKPGENQWWHVADAYGIEEFLRRPGNERYAIQGEVYGPGIQKNLLGYHYYAFSVFDVYDMVEHRYLTFRERRILLDDTKFWMVDGPEENCAFGLFFDQSVAEMKEMAKGFYPGTKNHREGIVVRNADDGPRVSFKVINTDYLLKNPEA